LFLLASAQSTVEINTGDIIFQLITFLIVLTIPVCVIIFVVVFRRRNSRLKRVEEKLDKLISDKDNEKL
jgi:heme/copper-type cytochrome/quinol oxidase subunit 2